MSLRHSVRVPFGLLLVAFALAPACGNGSSSTSGTGGNSSSSTSGQSSSAGGSTSATTGTATTSTGTASSSASTGTASAGTSTGAGGGGGHSGAPHLGAHGLSYYGYGANNAPSLDSPPLLTAPSGSTLIVSTGRGDLSAAELPTDNQGNIFQSLGTTHAYTLWPTSGTALYGLEGAKGGPNHVVSTTTSPGDEVTLAVVEVAEGSHIQDFTWVERLNGQAITSAAVTTTGPATLIAFWWGDADVGGDKLATPDNGFTVLDSIGKAGALVQCFVASKDVSAAGTYDVTWDATPAQGAQLWLVAVQ